MNLIEDYPNILSQYEVKGTIGKGTFSKVKLGINNQTKEKVAIKILEKSKIKTKNDFIRIKREIHILKNFSHINLIKTYEIIENANYHFIIMEYCKYGELFNYIIQKKRLSEKEACYYYYQLINGLEYIHSNGVVHRDLKPENLLISKGNILKIIDFGLSNFYNGDNLLKTPCGSPCYASPEMVSGKKYNGYYIDIWSTGIILFVMLCGFLPFEDKNNSILFKKIEECKVHYPKFISKIAKNLMKNILINDPYKRFTIFDIKKHSFYLKGKEIFKKIHPELFINEVISSHEINRINYNTDRIFCSDYLFDTYKRCSTQGKIENSKLNGERNYINIKPVKINIDYKKVEKKYDPYEIHTSEHKNNKESLIKDLEKLINSHKIFYKTINFHGYNTINTQSNNFDILNDEFTEKYNIESNSNDSKDKNDKIPKEQNSLKKFFNLQLSDNKKDYKYTSITTRSKFDKIYNEEKISRKNNLSYNRNPTNFELYGNDIKKIKGINPYNNINKYKYNTGQIKYMDDISNLDSIINNQNEEKLTEKYITNSIYSLENSINKTKSNSKNIGNNTININSIFHTKYSKKINNSDEYKKNVINTYQSEITKNINDLFQNKKSSNIVYRNKPNLIYNKTELTTSQDTRIETQFIETKKTYPKQYKMNLRVNRFNGEKKTKKINLNIENLFHHKGNIFESNNMNLNKKTNINQNNNHNINNNKHKNPINQNLNYINTENLNKKNKNKQYIKYLNHPLLKLGNKAYTKMNSALIASAKFDTKLKELTYTLSNLKNQVQGMRKSNI